MNEQSSKRRPGSIVFGLIVGVLVAYLSYQWVTDTDKRAQRELEERVVLQSREILSQKLALVNPEIVDPLAPQRKVGKVYVYPLATGWEVSGFYRRADGAADTDSWHPYLVTLDDQLVLIRLKISDDDLQVRDLAEADPQLELGE